MRLELEIEARGQPEVREETERQWGKRIKVKQCKMPIL